MIGPPDSCFNFAISSASGPEATRGSRQLASASGDGWALPAFGAGFVTSGSGLPLLVNTTFGIRFIGSANASVEYGQYDAMSRKVLLPMAWAPAPRIVSSVHLVASLSAIVFWFFGWLLFGCVLLFSFVFVFLCFLF